jgi:glycosyltransferase involved in cell wall biosynthesis
MTSFEDRSQAITLSVIVPCYNAARTIATQLEALSAQKWSEAWEVIIVDNGSRDGTLAIAQSYAVRLPELRIIRAAEKQGAAHARNAGARVAQGETLAFCDADDEVGPGWVAAMGTALQKYDLVASRFNSEKLNPPWLQSSPTNPQKEDVQKASYPPYLSHAGGSGLGVKRSVHELIGGFDESLPAQEDTDYCFRVQLAGLQLQFASDAIVFVRYRDDFRSRFRQARLWAEYNVLMYKKYRTSRVATLRCWQRYARYTRYLLWSLLETHSKVGRAAWLWRFGWQIGRLRGSIKYRTHPV